MGFSLAPENWATMKKEGLNKLHFHPALK